jgi:hypothetical protein
MAGETTSLAAGAWKDALYVPTRGDAGSLLVHSLLATYTAATQLELADVMQVAYLPANMTIYGVIVKASDLDTDGSPALVQKITVGSTDIVAGITAGQDGSSAVHVCTTPYTTAAYDLVKVTCTTAAATGASSGTLRINLLFTGG